MIMDDYIMEPPKIDKPLDFSYRITKADRERYERKKRRAEELGIRLFVLDGDDEESELQKLEDEIIYEYISMDLDVPKELKQKYLELKKQND